MANDKAWQLVRPDDSFPELYSQEYVKDPMVVAKFFAPASSWSWYVLEYDGKDEFFGLINGFEAELGYFSRSELEAARIPLVKGAVPNLRIERDLYFKPTPLSEIRKEIGR